MEYTVYSINDPIKASQTGTAMYSALAAFNSSGDASEFAKKKAESHGAATVIVVVRGTIETAMVGKR